MGLNFYLIKVKFEVNFKLDCCVWIIGLLDIEFDVIGNKLFSGDELLFFFVDFNVWV